MEHGRFWTHRDVPLATVVLVAGAVHTKVRGAHR